jgi:uncharacterized DUF497 family protein
VNFEWDKGKAVANLKKHLIAFPFAARVFLDTNRLERPDEGNQHESRWITVGLVDDLEILGSGDTRGIYRAW